MNPDDAQAWLQNRAAELKKGYEVGGKEALKGYTFNELALLGLSPTKDMEIRRWAAGKEQDGKVDPILVKNFQTSITEIEREICSRPSERER